MIETAEEFIKEHGQIIKDQTKYLKDVNWTSVSSRKDRIKEYELHNKLINTLTDKLQYVVGEAGDDNIKKNKKVADFIELVLNEVTNHNKRIAYYFKNEKWQEYLDQDEKSAEIDFQDDILKEMLKIKGRITKLKLDEEKKEVSIKIYGDAIVSLPMRKMIEDRYPEIKEFMEKKLSK